MTSDQNSGRATGSKARTRRGILAGAAGALAAVAAETATRGVPARAANGDPVLQGTDNGPVTSRTMVFTANNAQFASLCDSDSHGKGLVGVFGHGSTGVYGDGDTGVWGTSSTGDGLIGEGGGPTGSGVLAIANGGGDGVHAAANGPGNGVFGLGGALGKELHDTGAGVKGEGGGGGPGVSGKGGLNDGTGVHGTGSGAGCGVRGDGGAGNTAVSAAGVIGVGGAGTTLVGGPGVVGVGADGSRHGGPGVVGAGGNGSNGVEGTGGNGNGNGVWGMGQGTGAGVLGTSSRGPGVHGRADVPKQVAVLAENTAGGTALLAKGKAVFKDAAVFSRSGIITVRVGRSTVTKTGVPLTAASLVLATLQEHKPGIYILAAVPDINADSFTIHLSKAVPSRTKIAWFIVN